jgi:hypothetical protein
LARIEEPISIRRWRDDDEPNNELLWLVVAAQPVLEERAFDPFNRSIDIVIQHHDDLRQRLLKVGEMVSVGNVNGVVVCVMATAALRGAIGAAWEHLSEGPQKRLWGTKVAITSGWVVDISRDEATEPVDLQGQAIDEAVRLLRDVAEPGHLVVTESVCEELEQQGKGPLRGMSLTIEPDPLVQKALIPGAEETVGIARVLSSAGSGKTSKSLPVLIVYRPNLRAHLEAVERAVRDAQERFDQALTGLDGTLRGNIGASERFDDHTRDFDNILRRKSSPIAMLRAARKAGRAELDLHDDLDAAIDELIDGFATFVAQLEELADLQNKGLSDSAGFRTARDELHGLLPRVKRAPGHLLDEISVVRRNNQERL